jgi:hypothetical protein
MGHLINIRKGGNMRKIARLLICAVILYSVGCSTNPKRHKITAQNKAEFSGPLFTEELYAGVMKRQIPGFEKLTSDEKYSIFSFFMDQAIDPEAKPMAEGITVGEILTSQKRKATEIEELRKIISASIVFNPPEFKINEKRGYRLIKDPDIPEDSFDTFLVSGKNISSKDIRAFRGRFVFYSLFKERLYIFHHESLEVIKAGANYESNLLGLGTFKEDDTNRKRHDLHQKLSSMKPENIVVVWEPEKIVFADGTSKPEEDALK